LPLYYSNINKDKRTLIKWLYPKVLNEITCSRTRKTSYSSSPPFASPLRHPLSPHPAIIHHPLVLTPMLISFRFTFPICKRYKVKLTPMELYNANIQYRGIQKKKSKKHTRTETKGREKIGE
jgi:hypothetical protein